MGSSQQLGVEANESGVGACFLREFLTCFGECRDEGKWVC